MTPIDWYKKSTEGPLIDPELEFASDEDDDRDRGRSTLTPSISIWFQLEKWKDLKICHLLDPMHIFKNVGHSLWKHLTGLKDTEQAKNDLKERNYKSNLWPRVDEESRRKEYAHAQWVLTPTEIATINRWIRSIQTRIGYGASLQNIFTMDDSSLSNLKTHDWHNFLKVDLTFFIANHSYPFHVLIHLVEEIEIAGVVSTRWMFWVERFMGVLKGLVRQRARPKGSMSEGWVLGECMYYLVKYLERIDEGAPRKWTLDEPTILSDEILCGKGICFKSVDSSKPLRVTWEPYILPAHCEQAFFYATPDSNSPWRQVVPINLRGRRLFDTTYMEADQDSLHEDEPTSTKPLQLTTLAQEEPQEEVVDDNNAADDETEDLGMEFDFEPHHLEERPSIDVPPTLALDNRGASRDNPRQ
ncbi:hypothetical protein L7F22_038718 [Adiantum nelumboides]|nr:hypothetical protein [Adiantum nelumboides]